jgi:hypothetical protein
VVEYRIRLYPAENKDKTITLQTKIFNILTKLRIRIISPTRLKVKGPPKLATMSKNQSIANIGEVANPPPFIKYLRECDRSYMVLAPKNIPDEQTPCASIIITPPSIPQVLKDMAPTITSDICTTEEYAITTFMSLFSILKILNSPPPNNLKLNRQARLLPYLFSILRRTMPYPPSFNKIPASTIEPDTGASTWALGSQKWTQNIGNLTRKANNINTLNINILSC